MNKGQKIESSRSLFQPARYQRRDGSWGSDLLDAMLSYQSLNWDLASVLSTLSFGYAVGNRTLFHEVKRQPWISEIRGSGEIIELPIPSHGRKWMSSSDAASKLLMLLEDELESACVSFDHVQILLSGGLDSRIVAGVVKRLVDSGRVKSDITAVSWGIANSRDVSLAKEVADALGFRWKHVDLQQSQLSKNIDLCSRQLGASVSPIHLHRMDQLIEELPPNAIVLAGSYGDSVGRSEFSRRTVLELRPLKPFNFLGLMRPSLLPEAERNLVHEIDALRARAGDQPDYVYWEHQQQCHYMRGLIAQAMGVINSSAQVYQAFTSVEVYGFMWGLHPAARTDKIYQQLLRQLGCGLAAIPWARNNRSPDGKRRESNQLQANYHDYCQWTRQYLIEQMDLVGHQNYLRRFEVLEFLDEKRVSFLIDSIRNPGLHFNSLGHQPHGVFLWLESLLLVMDQLGSRISPLNLETQEIEFDVNASKDSRSSVRRILGANTWARSQVASIRRFLLRKKSLFDFPVER